MSPAQHTDRLLGESPAFLEILDLVSQIAVLNKPVLVVGERGTGKELIASRLHYLSHRWDQEYVKMNCAAINETLMETELFGHESGAFTGAAKQHRGRFERADKGTLFLDELANTSPLVQEKLLRVIEYGEYERVGGNKTLTTDVRLIAATNEDLPSLARERKFREDLLDRLAFDVITLPPLRERSEDILILAEQFAVNMATDLEREFFPGFSDTAINVLQNYHWPGNIRELKNVVERSVYRSQDPEAPIRVISLDPFESNYRPIRPGKAPAQATHPAAPEADAPAKATPLVPAAHEFPIDLKQSVQDYEIGMIKSALAASQFNQKKTAEALGVTYHQLRGLLKKYDLLES
ncbi:MAG: phage shock protein operon transcriptional activator [Proteobacteria bacterium]|nr:phage shock protein operon transcriptional activator [Pseudomonadota bacterium]